MIPNETHNNAALLKEVYTLAETLYLMSGGTVPDCCSFSRSLGEVAEHCYSCAVVVFYNTAANLLTENDR